MRCTAFRQYNQNMDSLRSAAPAVQAAHSEPSAVREEFPLQTVPVVLAALTGSVLLAPVYFLRNIFHFRTYPLPLFYPLGEYLSLDDFSIFGICVKTVFKICKNDKKSK